MTLNVATRQEEMANKIKSAAANIRNLLETYEGLKDYRNDIIDEHEGLPEISDKAIALDDLYQIVDQSIAILGQFYNEQHEELEELDEIAEELANTNFNNPLGTKEV